MVAYPAIKLANSGCEFPCTMTTSDDGKDSMAFDLSLFTGRKLPNLIMDDIICLKLARNFFLFDF